MHVANTQQIILQSTTAQVNCNKYIARKYLRNHGLYLSVDPWEKVYKDKKKYKFLEILQSVWREMLLVMLLMACLLLPLLLLLQPFNGLFSRTTWISRYRKGKTGLEDDGVLGWQWHQLDHMQTICTSLQTDNHTSTSSLSFYRPDALPDTQPTVSKHWRRRCYTNTVYRLSHVFTWQQIYSWDVSQKCLCLRCNM